MGSRIPTVTGLFVLFPTNNHHMTSHYSHSCSCVFSPFVWCLFLFFSLICCWHGFHFQFSHLIWKQWISPNLKTDFNFTFLWFNVFPVNSIDLLLSMWIQLVDFRVLSDLSVAPSDHKVSVRGRAKTSSVVSVKPTHLVACLMQQHLLPVRYRLDSEVSSCFGTFTHKNLWSSYFTSYCMQ